MNEPGDFSADFQNGQKQQRQRYIFCKITVNADQSLQHFVAAITNAYSVASPMDDDQRTNIQIDKCQNTGIKSSNRKYDHLFTTIFTLEAVIVTVKWVKGKAMIARFVY